MKKLACCWVYWVVWFAGLPGPPCRLPRLFHRLYALLYISDKVQHRWKYFGLLSGFPRLNVASTPGGWAILPFRWAAFLHNCFNALLMRHSWLGFKNTKRKLPESVAYFALIVYWLTFELHSPIWEFSCAMAGTWPWLLRCGWMDPVVWVYRYQRVLSGYYWPMWLFTMYGNGPAYTILPEADPVGESWKPLPGNWLTVDHFCLYICPVDNPARKTESWLCSRILIPMMKSSAQDRRWSSLWKFFTSHGRKSTDSNTRYIIWPETALFPLGRRGTWTGLSIRNCSHPEMLRKYREAKLTSSGAATMKRYLTTDENHPYRPLCEWRHPLGCL